MRDDDAFCANCGTPVQDVYGANNGYDPGGYPTDKGYVQTPEWDASGANNGYDPNSYQGGYEPVPNDVPAPVSAPVPVPVLAPVPAPMPVQPKKPKRKKLLIGIIAGAVVLLAVVIAVFLIPKTPTDYYIVRFTSGGGKDMLAEYCQESVKFPTHLHLSGKGEATLLNSDDMTYMTLSYDEKTLSGTLTSIAGGETDVTVSIDDKRFIIRDADDEGDSELIFEVPNTKELSGTYVMTGMHFDGLSDEELFESLTRDNKTFASKMTINEDGSGVCSSYSGKMLWDFTVDKHNMTLSGQNDTGDINGYLVMYDGKVAVYDSTGTTVYYERSNTVNHAAFEGEYNLTEATSDKIDNALEYWLQTKQKHTTKLTMNADGTGMLLYDDGTAYLDISLNKDETTGIVARRTSNQEEFPCYFRYREDAVTLYIGGKDIYSFAPAREKLTEDELGEYTVTRFINAVENTDFLEESIVKGKKLISRFTVKSDNTGTVLYSDDTEYAKLTLSPKDMTCTLRATLNNEEFSFYMLTGEEELTLYGINNENIINLSKNPFSGALRLIGSEDSAKGTLISYKSKDKPENQASKKTGDFLELKKEETGSYLHDNYLNKYLTYKQATMIGTMDSEEKAESTTTAPQSSEKSTVVGRLLQRVKEVVAANKKKQHKIFMTVYDDVVTVYNTDAQIVFKYQFEVPEEDSEKAEKAEKAE